MFAKSLARSPPLSGRRFESQSGASAPRMTLLLTALLLAGCSAVPPAPVAGPSPADANAAAPRAAYRTIVGPYASQRPSDPSAWREQNERIAPAEKP